MKGVDLSNYALEDLLAFDDIFLDYFNNFLKNQAFPQQIQYNRFLGIFEEIDANLNSIVITDRLPRNLNINNTNLSHRDSTDSDRSDPQNNSVFDWVRLERLPLFFRTDFFREFKLCKLLTRALEEERPNSATSSQLIGGYSRQSPPISNSLSTDDAERATGNAALFVSPSKEGSSNKITNFEELITNFYANGLESSFQIDLPYLERFNRALFQRPGSRALSVPSYFPFATMNRYASSNLLNKSGKKRTDTSKSNKSSFKSSTMNDINGSNLKKVENVENLTQIEKAETKQGENLSSEEDEIEEATDEYYDEEFENENQKDPNLKLDDNISFVDDDVENDEYIENVNLHASINQYKLKYLGSVHGMIEFRDFLKNTSGFRLYKFWLDCEFYRDSMQDYDQIDNMATRNRLFRDINEKYVFAFAKKMHDKISKNYFAGHGLNHSLFDRIQYDILRRLRSYWVPRFVLSKLKQKGKDYGAFPLPPLTPDYSRQSTYLSLPPSRKENISAIKDKKDSKQQELDETQKRTLYYKVRQALLADKDAGGPFLRYISGNCPEFLPLILFWYDVCDFNNSETIGYDKNSRLQHAWAIYNNYLSSTARFNVGISNEVSEEARKSLQKQSNPQVNFNTDIDKNLFQPVMEQIVPYLEQAWTQFIKDDVARYTEARLSMLFRDEDEDDEEIQHKLLQTIRDPLMLIENSQIYIKRSAIIDMLTNKGKPKKDEGSKKKVLTEVEKRERQERIRQMEGERKKALKAAAKRAKLNKLSALDEEKEDDPFKRKNTIANMIMNSSNNLASSSGFLSLNPVSINSNNNNNSSAINLTNFRNRIVSTSKSNDTTEKPERKSKKGISFVNDRSGLFEKVFNNKHMMQLFRKYFFDHGQKDLLNKFNAVAEAKQYLDHDELTKKNAIANVLMRLYLDPNSKKNLLPLPDRLKQKLKPDTPSDYKGLTRPKTPFMHGLLREFRGILEENYQKFCEQLANEYNLPTPEEFALLTQTELLTLLGDNYNPKDFDFDEEKGDGKSIPTREDRTEFSKMLYEWSIGKCPEKLYGFFSHLGEHGRKDGLPFLEKDLFFCIDTIRLKEINGEDVVKQKAQVMVDVYLDSQIPPSIQIDVSYETNQKLLKSASKITQGNHSGADFAVFDEVRGSLFKDLLPYWAGFKGIYKEGTNMFETKQDKMLKERLDEFLNMKNPSPSDFKLPPLSPQPAIMSPNLTNYRQNTGLSQNLNIVFSIATGIKYKDEKSSNGNPGRASIAGSNDRRNSTALPHQIIIK